MLSQKKARDLTEFGYNEPTSPGLPSHNTKEKSRFTKHKCFYNFGTSFFSQMDQ